MTTATVEILREAYEDNPASARLIEEEMGMPRGRFSAALAKEYLDDTKQDHLNHMLGKGVRPWEIVNVSAKLDPKQPWFGVEYETGYSSKAAYRKVINYIWREHPLTAIDHEGCGSFPCEITFAPVNMEYFMSRSYHMDRLLAYQKKASAPHAAHGAQAQIGTHVNVSTPAYRKLPTLKTHNVVHLLGRLNMNWTAKDYERVYGRRPYGGFNAMSDMRGNKWVEGKLFNSTGSTLVWAKYKRVMARIGELIEHLSRLASKDELPSFYKDKTGKAVKFDHFGPRRDHMDIVKCPNMPDFLLGNIELKDLEFTYVPYIRESILVREG